MLNKEVKEYLSNIGKEESYLETNMTFDYFEEKLKESIPYCLCVYAVKNDEIRICIEIVGNVARQYYGKNNCSLTGEDKKVFEQWAFKHNIILS